MHTNRPKPWQPISTPLPPYDTIGEYNRASMESSLTSEKILSHTFCDFCKDDLFIRHSEGMRDTYIFELSEFIREGKGNFKYRRHVHQWCAEEMLGDICHSIPDKVNLISYCHNCRCDLKRVKYENKVNGYSLDSKEGYLERVYIIAKALITKRMDRVVKLSGHADFCMDCWHMMAGENFFTF